MAGERPVFGAGSMAMAKARAFLQALGMFMPQTVNPVRVLQREMVDGHRHYGVRGGNRPKTCGTDGAFGGVRNRRLSFARLDLKTLTAEERKAAKRGGQADKAFGTYAGEQG